jgi:hypothetical protein
LEEALSIRSGERKPSVAFDGTKHTVSRCRRMVILEKEIGNEGIEWFLFETKGLAFVKF